MKNSKYAQLAFLIIGLYAALLVGGCAQYSQESLPSPGTVQDNDAVVGVAWRPNMEAQSFKSTCLALEQAGIQYVVLDQALSADLRYNDQKKLLEGVAETGALTPEAAKLVRLNSWQSSNAHGVLEGINAVVFPGGEDISPSLYYDPQEWHGIESERDYSAERDVSDYLLMDYCLEHDIPLLAICRSMQMLSVVSGATVIQDIPTWFEIQGIKYGNEHKQLADANGNRDFAPNDVEVEKNSILYDIVQGETLKGCPCWHHQCVESVAGTRLVVTARTETDGVSMIEAVERPDRTFAIGVQFHPEISVQKEVENAGNKADYLDYTTAISLFERLHAEAQTQLAEDPDNFGLPAAA